MRYLVRIEFDSSVIYEILVTACTKREAYCKAKKRIAKKLFSLKKLKNYDCTEY